MLFHVVEVPTPVDGASLDAVLSSALRERHRCERLFRRVSFRLFSAKVHGAPQAQVDELLDQLEAARADVDAATFDVERYSYPTRIPYPLGLEPASRRSRAPGRQTGARLA